MADVAYDIVEARSSPVIWSGEQAQYNTDSLEIIIDAMGNPGEVIQSGAIPGRYVLIAPDDLCSELGSYKGIMDTLGVSTSIVPLSETYSQGSLRGYLRWAHFYHTRYALLVGDANDAFWWDDPGRWTNGWRWPRVGGTGPHIPSQPDLNLIPTFYTAEADSPAFAMTFYTPYYASDLPYADVDNDGLPDLMIGRLPVNTAEEIIAYTAKLRAYLNVSSPPTGPRTVLLSYARDNGLLLGNQIEADADSVGDVIPPSADLDRITDTNATEWSYEHRETVADSVANTGPDRIIWMASGAQRDIYANFWRIDHGWSMTKLSPVNPPGRFFVSLGFSCGMGNFDQTEDYSACDSIGPSPANCSGPIEPIAERLLLDATKGAIAVIGPTRGSYEAGNVIFARALTKELAVVGRDLGTAFMVAQRSCLVRHPEYSHLFRSYVLLGDPVLGGPILTGVATEAPRYRSGLGTARPNPFNPSTTLMVRAAAAGRAVLRIFDAHGRLVRTLLDAVLPAGERAVIWNGRNNGDVQVASGVYIARLGISGKSFEQKLVLLK